MTREELVDKIARFYHGVDSHGNLLRPWNHGEDCVMCHELIAFIEKILEGRQTEHSCLGVLRQRIWIDTGSGTLKCVIAEGSTQEELREAVQRIIK